eukprot:c20557_g2_i1 orf=276-686(-)
MIPSINFKFDFFSHRYIHILLLSTCFYGCFWTSITAKPAVMNDHSIAFSLLKSAYLSLDPYLFYYAVVDLTWHLGLNDVYAFSPRYLRLPSRSEKGNMDERTGGNMMRFIPNQSRLPQKIHIHNSPPVKCPQKREF